jgi:hypothetical protein
METNTNNKKEKEEGLDKAVPTNDPGLESNTNKEAEETTGQNFVRFPEETSGDDTKKQAPQQSPSSAESKAHPKSDEKESKDDLHLEKGYPQTDDQFLYDEQFLEGKSTEAANLIKEQEKRITNKDS